MTSALLSIPSEEGQTAIHAKPREVLTTRDLGSGPE